MIPVDQAVAEAVKFFQALSKNGGPQELRVEEVEMSEDGSYWLITLGFTVLPHLPFLQQSQREYKLFRVNASTGQVEAMKIRTVK